MFYGKIIAGLIGLLVAGPIGLIFGIFIGHSFDKGLVRTFGFASPENIARIKTNFFETTFLLLGHLAKADGRISQQEVDHTELIITQMGLDGQQRKRAIELFQQGSAQDFQLESVISAFNQTCGAQKQLQQTLLLFLISLALADDHTIVDSEQAALQRIASLMGFSAGQLQQLLRMAQAQEQFHSRSGAASSSGISLSDAYVALGVDEGVTDKELKRAYRRLMSQNHPDKLIAKGVPEDMIKIATEKSQEIQSAYEMVRKQRAGAR
ncbi:MAG: co-chaperone DjlA [Halioglobus sp.]